MPRRIAERDRRNGLIWCIWFVLFIWLIEFNQTNQIDQINEKNHPGLALHAHNTPFPGVVLAGLCNHEA
jgi:hypothetical protein